MSVWVLLRRLPCMSGTGNTFHKNGAHVLLFKIVGDQHAQLCEWCCEVVGLPQEEIGTHAERDLQPELSSILLCIVWREVQRALQQQPH